jgi:ubiquinone/menaquinone biosynthesis C-methylase UbiE
MRLNEDGMNNKQSKLEDPKRLEELSPEQTLRRIGFAEGQILCDVGAGTGIFSIPAAKVTHNTVYALEISDEMLEIIAGKANEQGLGNVVPVKVKGDDFGVPGGSIDLILLVAVLHEIQDKHTFLAGLQKLLKPGGKVALIEFHKGQTPNGPPAENRLGREEATAFMQAVGLGVSDDFDLGENVYCMVFI